MAHGGVDPPDAVIRGHANTANNAVFGWGVDDLQLQTVRIHRADGIAAHKGNPRPIIMIDDQTIGTHMPARHFNDVDLAAGNAESADKAGPAAALHGEPDH